ncbi:MAG: DUF4293 domain-containing protein [Flavobacteriaceae bacterium]|nr:MAG: DUF4293 domain-containing protein [Flavobacteriaceae bacterium]
MIQRIQSLFLFASAIISAIGALLVFKSDLFLAESNLKNLLLVGFTASAFLSLGSLFMYKNRMFQIKLNLLNFVLNLVIIGLFVFYLLNLSGGVFAPEKGIWLLLPIFAMGSLVLANRHIRKDQELVKSVDRIR